MESNQCSHLEIPKLHNSVPNFCQLDYKNVHVGPRFNEVRNTKSKNPDLGLAP